MGARNRRLGGGRGMLASQRGNVVQSSVGGEERSEAGGMQFTAQNLGSSLGGEATRSYAEKGPDQA